MHALTSAASGPQPPCFSRSFSSLAALLVKVMARMWEACTLCAVVGQAAVLRAWSMVDADQMKGEQKLASGDQVHGT